MVERVGNSVYMRGVIALAFLAPLFFIFAYLLPGAGGPVGFVDAQLGRYEVDYSLRFNDDDSPNFTKTFTQVGSTTEWTFSTWVKRGNLGSAQYLLGAGHNSSNYTALLFDSSDRLQYINIVSGSTNANKITNAVFRDPAAWIHIVLAVDTSQGTAASRNRLYVNGTEITSFSTDTNHGSGNVTWVTDNNNNANTNIVHYISRNPTTAANYFDGYLSEAYLIDGQQLTPSSFGFSDSNGYWRPKAYLGTSSGANSFFGTNGFYFNFASTTALGWNLASTSSYAARWTSSGLDATDQMIDTPSHSFAAFNNLDKSGSTGTYSQGNLVWLNSSGTGNFAQAYSSIWMTTGKWYAEFYMNDVTNGDVGFITGSINPGTNRYLGQDSYTYAYANDSGNKVNNASGSAYGASYTIGDTISVAIDADAGSVTFYKNCASQGAAFTGLTGPYRFALDGEISGGANANFGQLKYATSTATVSQFRDSAGGHFMCNPPSGYKALSTANLPDVAIQKPGNYFNTVLYTGNGATTDRAITGVGFQGSFAWFKNRGAAANHVLIDDQRSGFPSLFSNATNAEIDEDEFVSFDSDGFTIKTNASYDRLNSNTYNFVSWVWRESATSGFDIVTYTGNGANRTISHSLSSAPEMIIVKNRTAASTDDWAIYHSSNTSAPETDYLLLNSTAATADDATYWNDTAPTASVFSVGTNADVNTNTNNYVAYLFAEVPGFSKFGSYTGNGSADGPFVYTGFKPRYVMIKDVTLAGADWHVSDSARDTYNPVSGLLRPDTSGAETTTAWIDLLSNGFKLRFANGAVNNTSDQYIYAAFAEQPFKLSATNRYPYFANLFEASGETIFTKAVSITGGLSVQYQLSKGAGTFVIDHPLDPKNKLLYHSFVESPDQKNIYDGIAELDENGEAIVELPDYFLALNTDYRYLATPVGESMPELHLERGVMRRWFGLIGAPAFKLSGGVPGGRVSWQVSGVRQDPYALDNPIIPEVEKGPDQLVEKGEYLHPEFYEQ